MSADHGKNEITAPNATSGDHLSNHQASKFVDHGRTYAGNCGSMERAHTAYNKTYQPGMGPYRSATEASFFDLKAMGHEKTIPTNEPMQVGKLDSEIACFGCPLNHV